MSVESIADATVRFRRFRLRLVVAMMLVVSLLTAAGLLVAERHLDRELQREIRRDFRGALDALASAREFRVRALTERCLQLVQKARIHAALEDDALDLLYPNARDELADLTAARPASTAASGNLAARFWRFLDSRGAVIPVVNSAEPGPLTPAEASSLVLPSLPDEPQIGYMVRETPGGTDDVLDQVITTPIFSTTTRRPIAALCVGFDAGLSVALPADTIHRGLWSGDRLHLPGWSPAARRDLLRELQANPTRSSPAPEPLAVSLGGVSYLVLSQPLNEGSRYPVVHEVCLYSLAATAPRRRKLQWQILGLGSVLMVAGLVASQMAATRLSRPVEQLAADSVRNADRRRQAEAALELSQAELQRAARFSSDASHQLKTPIAVFRAGLDELLARDDLPEAAQHEVLELVNQTHRLTAMIEDLLLLSRLDEGRLQIEFSTVDLTHLVASWLDDLTVRPETMDVRITTALPSPLLVAGERRYVAMILQNLLENARKYNRPGGRIHLAATTEGAVVRLTIGNTGRGIPVAAQPHIFNRFHRGDAAENIPGHGLGLNLARELARRHGGDIELLTSDNDWTEFEVRFRLANPAQTPLASRA